MYRNINKITMMYSDYEEEIQIINWELFTTDNLKNIIY